MRHPFEQNLSFNVGDKFNISSFQKLTQDTVIRDFNSSYSSVTNCPNHISIYSKRIDYMFERPYKILIECGYTRRTISRFIC